MSKLRVAIIGIGNMGSAHAKHILEGKVKDMELAAVCDNDPAKLEWATENLPDVAQYSDYHKLLDDHAREAHHVVSDTIIQDLINVTSAC